jgi:hypothetical protein
VKRKRSRRKVGRARKLIKAFAAGAGLGAAAGLLTPPKTAKPSEPSVEVPETESASSRARKEVEPAQESEEK